MNTYYTNYRICYSYLSNIDEKYKQQITLDKNLIFLYTNFIEITKFYNLAHPFYNNLSILNKFKFEPKTFFKNLIDYIKKNSYNKRDITLLYSLAVYFVLTKNETLKELKFNNDLKEFITDTKKVNYFLEFKEARSIDPYILSTFNQIINESFNIYNADNILKISLNYFKRYSKKSILLKLKYYMFCFSKNYKKLDIYKKGFELKFEVINLNNEIDIFFEAINDYLFFNKTIKFNKYFGG